MEVARRTQLDEAVALQARKQRIAGVTTKDLPIESFAYPGIDFRAGLEVGGVPSGSFGWTGSWLVSSSGEYNSDFVSVSGEVISILTPGAWMCVAYMEVNGEFGDPNPISARAIIDWDSDLGDLTGSGRLIAIGNPSENNSNIAGSFPFILVSSNDQSDTGRIQITSFSVNGGDHDSAEVKIVGRML